MVPYLGGSSDAMGSLIDLSLSMIRLGCLWPQAKPYMIRKSSHTHFADGVSIQCLQTFGGVGSYSVALDGRLHTTVPAALRGGRPAVQGAPWAILRFGGVLTIRSGPEPWLADFWNHS